jgi:UDP-N-acetylmuramoyl-tripeptide--D-alanyl-D-alanine ligase
MAEEPWATGRSLPEGIACIVVTDTLRALGDLAAWHRRRFQLPVIAVTGSNGKTTTKEMLGEILSRTGEGVKTHGNLNNLVGLPRMLFLLTEASRWAVLEMGMSEPGEIDRLAEMAAPRVGLITNVHAAHLESMGSVEAVARAKGELFARLPAGGAAVINADAPLVSDLPTPPEVKRLNYGFSAADVRGVELESLGASGQRLTMEVAGERVTVTLKALGRHNASNALAATAAALAIGVPLPEICQGLEAFSPFDRRLQPEQVGGVLLLDDSYNANPASVRAALETLQEMGRGRKVAVLGDMLELGKAAEEAHKQMGRLCAATVQRLLLLGEMAPLVADAALSGGMAKGAVTVAGSREELIAALEAELEAGDCLLVKGSRGMKMDQVAAAVRQRAATREATGGDA